jgi:hypothetical protein
MMAEELVAELIYPAPPEQPEESMDPTSAMAFSIRVQKDLWSEMDSDRPDSTILPPLER